MQAWFYPDSPCGSSLCQKAASVLEVSCETAKFSQLEAVLGFHSVCPEREGSRELNLTQFPLMCAVAVYFAHFDFKGRNTKSLLEGAGSILGNSLSDEIGAIINFAAYELNTNSAFQLTSPTASPANSSHFAQQLKPSSATQTRIITNNLGALLLLFGWGKKEEVFPDVDQVFW